MMHCLRTGFLLRNASSGNVDNVNITECAYANLGSTVYYTPSIAHPSASRLQTSTACYQTKLPQIKSNTRENDAMERHGEHEM